MANRAWMNFGRAYQNLTSPARVNLNFSVDSTNGLGINSLKSNGYIKNVYMHTATTPSGGNPNPANGLIWIQLRDNFAKLINVSSSIISPLTGSELSTQAGDAALTVGAEYVITTLGTNTAADWSALGLPAGLTAAVGMSFIALVTGSGSHSGKVKAVGVSSISSIEISPNPQMELGPQGVSNQGGWIMLRCLKPSVSSSSSAPTFTGNSNTTSSNSAGTPAGSISAGNIPVAAGTAGDAVTNNAGVLNSTGGQDLTVDAQTFTGSAMSGHTHTVTPTGTISAPTITSTVSMALGAPADSSVIMLSLLLDMSSVNVDGL